MTGRASGEAVAPATCVAGWISFAATAHPIESINHGADHCSTRFHDRPSRKWSSTMTSAGTTIADGFASIAAINTSVASAYCTAKRFDSAVARASRRYSAMAVSDNAPARTSFNPDTQATDSTCTGCRANSSEPIVAAAVLLKSCLRTANIAHAAAMWMRRLSA